MAFYRDFSRCDCLPLEDAHRFKAIGWLAAGRPFRKGTVSEAFYAKLRALANDSWGSRHLSLGSHRCEICQFEGAVASGQLFIPDDRDVIYVAPVMITHYVACHSYRPPNKFIAAVLDCPEMRSEDYQKAMLARGGRELAKVVAAPRLPS